MSFITCSSHLSFWFTSFSVGLGFQLVIFTNRNFVFFSYIYSHTILFFWTLLTSLYLLLLPKFHSFQSSLDFYDSFPLLSWVQISPVLLFFQKFLSSQPLLFVSASFRQRISLRVFIGFYMCFNLVLYLMSYLSLTACFCNRRYNLI